MNKLGRTKEIIKLEDIKFKPNSLINLNIVVTGALEHFSRKNIEKLVKELGGTFQRTINSKTSLLVIGGEHIGSKYKKAVDLNLKIIDEMEFLEMIVLDEYNKFLIDLKKISTDNTL